MSSLSVRDRGFDEEERKRRALKAIERLRMVYSDLMKLPHDKAKSVAVHAIRTLLNVNDPSTYKVFIGETEQKIIVRVR